MSEPTSFDVERVRPAYRQVADQLRAKIFDGQLRPGDRLPVETELAELFGVSRSTVREALRHLSSQQLVETHRGAGGGTRITQPTLDDIEHYLESSLALMATSGDMRRTDLLEARVALETPAAGWAAERRSGEQLDDIASALFDPASDPPDVVARRSRRFHLEILAASGNATIRLLGRSVYTILAHTYIEKASSDAFWRQVDTEHRAIHAAIDAGDADQARRSMADHLGALVMLYRELDRTP